MRDSFHLELPTAVAQRRRLSCRKVLIEARLETRLETLLHDSIMASIWLASRNTALCRRELCRLFVAKPIHDGVVYIMVSGP